MEIYARLIAAASSYGEPVADFLRAELPHVWFDAYLGMTSDRPPNVSVITRGTFDYLYDDYDTAAARRQSRLVACRPALSRDGNLLLDPRGRLVLEPSQLHGWIGNAVADRVRHPENGWRALDGSLRERVGRRRVLRLAAARPRRSRQDRPCRSLVESEHARDRLHDAPVVPTNELFSLIEAERNI
jgi:hypothetical protein